MCLFLISRYLLNLWYYSFYADTLLTNCKKIDVLKGVVEESKLSLDALREDRRSAFMIYYDTVKMRKGIAKVLTKLDEEVACKTTGNAGTFSTGSTEEPIGYGLSKKSIYILFLLLMHKLLHQISDV